MEILDSVGQGFQNSFAVFNSVWREGWFIFVPIVLFYMMAWYWKDYMVTQFVKSINFINLEISVPPENEQSPKVMEEFFNALHSVQTNPNFLDRFWKGKIQEWYSIEIVGLGGDVHFIVRCPDYFKDAVEAHLYAQFPDVEIKQVDDYAEKFPADFEKAGLDLFGADMVLVNKDFYPIRTYPNFEHQMTQRIIDPIATAAEVMNKLNPDEQLWVQFVIRPVMTDWAMEGQKFAKELMGQDVPKPNPVVLEALSKAGEFAGTLAGAGGGEGASEEFPTSMFLIPPNERKVVENIERNVSKLAFQFKGRLMYLGNAETFDKNRFKAIMGSYKLFNTYDMNGFKPYKNTFTRVDYFFKKPRVRVRKNLLLKAYKTRSFTKGPAPQILTTESLASLFHIPDITVKTPRLERTMAKKGSAPTNLPLTEVPNL